MKKIQLGHHRKGVKYTNPIMYALVDDDDFEYLNQWKWFPMVHMHTKRPYAVRKIVVDGKRKTLQMHRDILPPPKGCVVDHINHNELDNRKKNLRIATLSQNMWNRRPNKNGISRYKGVNWHAKMKKWTATLRVKNKSYFMGLFDNEIDAANAYDEAAKLHFGKFAYLNNVLKLKDERDNI